ncbi:hypothetical protein BESB_006060 [Besnoitia besnoiti]|uniref:Uncharacterized protein n=1 Tax=Besnoitia besnoiti TaxID=94643 RepID=A0A2A9MJW7_BESBE|nr:hypothetical protein BESB_006060 [Besnoitia besnoiti]PFH38265.1 hypothetical protein BESB_006060 [Besnoitia besnoiti]
MEQSQALVSKRGAGPPRRQKSRASESAAEADAPKAPEVPSLVDEGEETAEGGPAEELKEKAEAETGETAAAAGSEPDKAALPPEEVSRQPVKRRSSAAARAGSSQVTGWESERAASSDRTASAEAEDAEARKVEDQVRALLAAATAETAGIGGSAKGRSSQRGSVMALKEKGLVTQLKADFAKYAQLQDTKEIHGDAITMHREGGDLDSDDGDRDRRRYGADRRRRLSGTKLSADFEGVSRKMSKRSSRRSSVGSAGSTEGVSHDSADDRRRRSVRRHSRSLRPEEKHARRSSTGRSERSQGRERRRKDDEDASGEREKAEHSEKATKRVQLLEANEFDARRQLDGEDRGSSHHPRTRDGGDRDNAPPQRGERDGEEDRGASKERRRDTADGSPERAMSKRDKPCRDEGDTSSSIYPGEARRTDKLNVSLYEEVPMRTVSFAGDGTGAVFHSDDPVELIKKAMEQLQGLDALVRIPDGFARSALVSARLTQSRLEHDTRRLVEVLERAKQARLEEAQKQSDAIGASQYNADAAPPDKKEKKTKGDLTAQLDKALGAKPTVAERQLEQLAQLRRKTVEPSLAGGATAPKLSKASRRASGLSTAATVSASYVLKAGSKLEHAKTKSGFDQKTSALMVRPS